MSTLTVSVSSDFVDFSQCLSNAMAERCQLDAVSGGVT